MKEHCIHTLAEKYLNDLQRGNAHFYQTPGSTDRLEIADAITERVVIMREETPSYFVGFKPSGRPVFTHDIKLAVSHDSASLKLVEVLARFQSYDLHVETMPATWFSNHQRG